MTTTTAAAWTAFPYPDAAYRHDRAALAAHWTALHAGDAEPLPDDERLLDAWGLFHAGDFEQAMHAGLRVAADGLEGGASVANQAQLAHASYLEPSERAKIAHFHDVETRAQAVIARRPRRAAPHYELAVALVRCSRSLNTAKVMTGDVARRIRSSLETALELAPLHADAHLALGAFHAETIDKLGGLLGSTQGASKELGMAAVREGLRLNPASAVARVAAADALVMLGGDKRQEEAERLYAEAAAVAPLDALERLGVELAKAALADD